MKKISTGEPSTLGTYKRISKIFGKKAEQFMQDKIDNDKEGEDGEVIADESQMLVLFSSMLEE